MYSMIIADYIVPMPKVSSWISAEVPICEGLTVYKHIIILLFIFFMNLCRHIVNRL